jgi:hypothetical protein
MHYSVNNVTSTMGTNVKMTTEGFNFKKAPRRTDEKSCELGHYTDLTHFI